MRSVATRSGASPAPTPGPKSRPLLVQQRPGQHPQGEVLQRLGRVARQHQRVAVRQADAAIHVGQYQAVLAPLGVHRRGRGYSSEKVTTRRRSWPSCTSAGLTGSRLRAEEGGRQNPMDSVCRPGRIVGAEADGEAIADLLPRAPALDRVGAAHRRVVEVAPGAAGAVEVEEDAPAGQIAGAPRSGW